jgi:hypothetical protein
MPLEPKKLIAVSFLVPVRQREVNLSEPRPETITLDVFVQLPDGKIIQASGEINPQMFTDSVVDPVQIILFAEFAKQLKLHLNG